MSLRADGATEASNVLKDITNTSPSRASKYQSAFKSASLLQQTEISGDLALSDVVQGKMTRQTYRIIRKRESQNNVRVYPPYPKVAKAKNRCYPPGINVTETKAEVPLQSLLDHISSRILTVQNDVIRTSCTENVQNLVLLVKYGFDGSSGQSQYKQKFEDENASDSSMLLTSLVPLRLFKNENQTSIIWQNPKPSSPRFCSPIKIQYIKEDQTSILQEEKYVKEQIEALVPYRTVIHEKEIIISYKLFFTMIDGKIRNVVTVTKSNMRCYLCKATSKQFNNLKEILALPVEEENLRFGLAILHACIHFMEYFLHLAYKLETKNWQARSKEDKNRVEVRKKEIQQKFKREMGLIIDTPKVGGFGNSNDGNTARRFFSNCTKSAEILGLDVECLNRAHVIMQVLSCGFAVEVNLFKKYCLDTAELLIKTYPWYYMPT